MQHLGQTNVVTRPLPRDTPWVAGSARRLDSVLFLDVVGSTAVAARLGDTRWRTMLTAFNRAVRAELKRFGGHEEDTAGDGFFATFPQPTAAVRCACAIVERVREMGLEVRVGVHTGETELIERKRGGMTVVIGARVMALARAGEVLVTSTTRDLVTGSNVDFEPRGEHELKGSRVAGRCLGSAASMASRWVGPSRPTRRSNAQKPCMRGQPDDGDDDSRP